MLLNMSAVIGTEAKHKYSGKLFETSLNPPFPTPLPTIT